MLYTKTAIESRVNELYPEIMEHGIIPIVAFNDERNTWAITLVKGLHEFTVNMSASDADACMDEIQCDHFKTRLAKVVTYLLEIK